MRINCNINEEFGEGSISQGTKDNLEDILRNSTGLGGPLFILDGIGDIIHDLQEIYNKASDKYNNSGWVDQQNCDASRLHLGIAPPFNLG